MCFREVDDCGTTCIHLFGLENLDMWCETCRREYDHWVDEQAAAAYDQDRLEGLGWLYHALQTPSEN
ncbi:MAG: hypothetical protein WKF75_05620 [Singulisphaera sp.]